MINKDNNLPKVNPIKSPAIGPKDMKKVEGCAAFTPKKEIFKDRTSSKETELANRTKINPITNQKTKQNDSKALQSLIGSINNKLVQLGLPNEANVPLLLSEEFISLAQNLKGNDLQDLSKSLESFQAQLSGKNDQEITQLAQDIFANKSYLAGFKDNIVEFNPFAMDALTKEFLYGEHGLYQDQEKKLDEIMQNFLTNKMKALDFAMPGKNLIERHTLAEAMLVCKQSLARDYRALVEMLRALDTTAKKWHQEAIATVEDRAKFKKIMPRFSRDNLYHALGHHLPFLQRFDRFNLKKAMTGLYDYMREMHSDYTEKYLDPYELPDPNSGTPVMRDTAANKKLADLPEEIPGVGMAIKHFRPGAKVLLVYFNQMHTNISEDLKDYFYLLGEVNDCQNDLAKSMKALRVLLDLKELFIEGYTIEAEKILQEQGHSFGSKALDSLRRMSQLEGTSSEQTNNLLQLMLHTRTSAGQRLGMQGKLNLRATESDEINDLSIDNTANEQLNVVRENLMTAIVKNFVETPDLKEKDGTVIGFKLGYGHDGASMFPDYSVLEIYPKSLVDSLNLVKETREQLIIPKEHK